MGYESKLFIVNTKKRCVGFPNKQGKEYAQIIATFDVCKFPMFQRLFTKETNYFIYADDGNTEITEDLYGKPLTEASVQEVIDCLNNFKVDDESYYQRRIIPLLDLLQACRDNESEWDGLAVLHYGH